MTLPEGRITMLFTDIEGSTSHLRRLGDGYAAVLADQRRILRGAIAAHGGQEMGTEGDSFFVVFADAADGVAAAVDAQRALAAHPWTGDAPIRIRMGLHCGDLTRHEEGYVGLELNRAARIASTANGGQIVVSASIRDEVAGWEYRDLGLHRLKDMPAPEQLFQLLADGVPDITTPIKSLGAASNLPPARTDLVGRLDDIDRVAQLVVGGARLVTLTGPGGVGKTALALASAAALDRRFAGGGIYFVDLTMATGVGDAWLAIADAVGVRDLDGGDDAAAGAVTALASSDATLLVLDNLEQLADAADVVVRLLDETPSVVLGTSRGPLRLRGEQQYPVAPLAEDVAMELFVREARRVRPSFEPDESERALVADICRKVDGLPLAVELVASRVRHLGIAALARSLEDRLDVSSRDRDRPDRQRTLFSTVAWSADLLDSAMRRQFGRLGVFAGGCTVEAAAAVLGVDEGDAFDALDALADLSLVSFMDMPDGGARIFLLHVVREYASSLLRDDEDDESQARAAHAAYFAALAEDAERRLHGGPEQLAAGDRLSIEHDNLQSAFEWSQAADHQLAARIAAALGWFWYTHGRSADGRRWLERTAAWDLAALDPALAVRTAQALGVLQQQQGESDAALVSLTRALELARAAGDLHASARALNSLGVTHWAEGRLEIARGYFQESVDLGRELGDEQRMASGLSNLGVVLLTARTDLDEAVRALREALVIDRRRGDRWGVAVDQTNLGAALACRGDLREGVDLLRATLPTSLELGDPDLVASGIEDVAMAAAFGGDPRRVVALVAAADLVRAKASVPRTPSEEAFLERELGPARAALGRSVVDELTAAASASDGDVLALVDEVARALSS